MGRLNYEELSKRKIKPSRNVVVSRTFKGNQFIGYSVSEQAVVSEGSEDETKVFLKNGMGIMDMNGLMELKSAVEEAIYREEERLSTENK